MHSKKDHSFLISSLISFFVFVLFFFFVNAQTAIDIDKDGVIDGYDAYLSGQISAGKIPATLFGGIRTFVLDAQGASMLQSDNTQKDSYFTEYKNNTPSWSWKTKFQRKGHARGDCNPPMLNISFDKNKSDGTPRPLFDGVTTYNNLGVLKYQEIRAVSNCSSDDSYGSAGFGSHVGPHLREYFIFSLFRNFSIPTADVIGFGVVKFVNTADTVYNGKSFPYMFLQRNSELDDQIPLTTQFGLKPQLIEDGKWDEFRLSADNNYPNPSFLKVFDVKQSKEIKVEFDPEAIMRYRLFSLFADPGDRGPLHNEEYGQLVASDKWVSIAHGFDLSLWSCWLDVYTYSLIDYERYLDTLSTSEQATFKPLFYKIGYETFSKKENLYKMLAIVDQFPLEKTGSIGKKKLKEFIRLQFSAFNQYFSDPDTARRFGVSSNSSAIDYFPFTNQETFIQKKQLFAADCRLTNPTPDIKLTITNISDAVISDKGNKDFKTISFKVSAEVSSNKQYALVPKENPLPAFANMKYISQEGNEVQAQTYFYSTYTKPAEFVDEVGLYYVLPSYTKAKIDFTVTQSFDALNIVPGDYTLNIAGLKLHTTQSPINVSGDLKSKQFSIAPVCPPVPAGSVPKISSVFAEKSSSTGEVKLTWSKSPYIPKVDIVLVGPLETATLGKEQTVIGQQADGKVPVALIKPAVKIADDLPQKALASRIDTNTFTYKIDNITPGSYVFQVISSQCVKARGQSNAITLHQVNTGRPQVTLIKDAESPLLKLTYDQNQKEVALISQYKFKITAPETDIYFDRNFLVATDLPRQSGGGSNRQVITLLSGNVEARDNFYKVKANSSIIVDVKIYYNPNQMFAGSFKDSISHFYISNDNGSYFDISNPTGTETESIVIVGERAPFIRTIFPVNPVSQNQDIKISGERFPVNSKIIFSGKNVEFTYNTQSDGKTIEFKPSDVPLPPGGYNLHIESPEGNSNSFYFEVVENVGALRKVKLLMGNVLQGALNFFLK